MIPIIDLHSDLLSYLSDRPNRSPVDPISRSSYPQLTQGNVKLQTLAIFSKTETKSVENGRKQIDHFFKLISHYPTMFAPFPLDAQKPEVHLIPAFENGSAFASETEPLSDVIQRLEGYLKALGHLFYISLTWDEENRFGGGNRSTSGLKADGKRLVEWMHGKRIALDFSHTSDKLAYDLLNFIDQSGCDLPIIASHSNFRAISEYPRNLPDDLAKEIIRRKGLIGLNLFAPFIHKTDPFAIVRQVEYGLALGGENALSFGADFFCDSDFPDIMAKYQRSTSFYPQFSDSSSYPILLELFAEHLKLNEQQLHKVASQNALHFLKERILK
ncbi:MAG: membrane dipeptidase [Rhabdochlamydiaceae bacterium]|jgi:membrane dipeptidase